MKTPLAYSFLMMISLAAVSACAPYKPDNVHAGDCNQLNSDLIFNGNTSNIRDAEIQRAETPLVQHNYDRKCS